MLAVAWHPLVPGAVAFGTEDGTVGCSVLPQPPAGVASWAQRHSGPVTELSWHPSEGWGDGEGREAAEEAAEVDRGAGPAEAAGPLLRLFSAGAEGNLMEWPPLRWGAIRCGREGG